MTIIRVTTGTAVIVMVAAVAHGLTVGALRSEAAQLLGIPWGRVAIADLYVGLALFAGWIWLRERSLARTLPWMVTLAVLGNLAAAVYCFAAAQASADRRQFLLGAEASMRVPSP